MQVSFGASLQNGLSTPRGKQIYQALNDLFNNDPAISVLGQDKFTPDVTFSLKAEDELAVQSKTYTGTIPFVGDITTDAGALGKVAQQIFNTLAGRMDQGDVLEQFARAAHNLHHKASPAAETVHRTWSSLIDGYYVAKRGGNTP